MLKHLTGINKRNKIGQDTPLLSEYTTYDFSTNPDLSNAFDIYNTGQFTPSTVNNFDWVDFVDSLGNLVSVGFDAWGNIIVANAQADAMAATATMSLPLATNYSLEPAGVLTPGDTQMWLTVALIGIGLIYISRKL